MSKFLIFSDFHISGRNPRSRIDNYYQSCLQKLDEIIDLSKSVDCVICAGDFWDSPIVANSMVDDVLDRIDINKKEFYFIYGNHDILNYNVDASNSSSLAHMMRRSKYVKHLNSIEDKNVYIKGYDCEFNKEQILKKEGLFHKSNKEFTLAITHQFITLKPFIKEVAHVQAKDIKTNYSIIWCSHFHTNFDEIINSYRFINLNSIGRSAINEQHQPRVAILDTETRKIEVIQLKSAKKSDEIFDLSKYAEIKQNEKSIDEFIEALSSATWRAADICQQIEMIGKDTEVEKEVVDYLHEKIKAVKMGE
jgi:DNA repair exonuclease SbcCD nuclease subunit